MKYTWIKQALNAGGKLSVSAVMPGRSILRAKMEWDNEKPVTGKISMSLDGALEQLEAALTEDAANEMLEKGQV